jgi:cytochrome c2
MLVLYGERLSIPAMRPTEAGLSAGLSSGHGWDPEVFSEYLDLARWAIKGSDVVFNTQKKFEIRYDPITLMRKTLCSVAPYLRERCAA